MKVSQQLSGDELKKIQKTAKVKDLPSLPELIEQKNLHFTDLTEAAQKELRDYYPNLYILMKDQ